jgi:hypothetical protein
LHEFLEHPEDDLERVRGACHAAAQEALPC